MTPYAKNFQCALHRARERLLYARKQRVAYEAYASDSEPSKRTMRKLLEDEKRAQLDYSWAEHKLSEALAANEVDTAFKAKCRGTRSLISEGWSLARRLIGRVRDTRSESLR